VLAQ